jgi:4-diphosphocytidyl-2-C-methyl-D-erythritol kinase
MTTPTPTTLRAGCKINLFLHIAGRRPNGYHDLITLFHPLSEPHDELIVEPAAVVGGGLKFACDIGELASPSNIVCKAYEAFAQATGFAPDVSVRLEKRIPSGAGLGGGSADAAVFLRWLNDQAADRALDREALITLAAGLGADVPFFLENRPAWATGIGEELTPASVNLHGYTVLLVCPEVHVSTAWAYREFDRIVLDAPSRSASHPTLTAHAERIMQPVSGSTVLRNDFEEVVFGAHPELRRLKESLLLAGAAGALMSGSGSSIFGLFADRATAQRTAQELVFPELKAYII